MGFMLFTARKRILHSQIYTYQSKIDTVMRKITDLQQYASNISDGSMSLNDLANTPHSLFDRSYAYMMYSEDTANRMAGQKWTTMEPIYNEYVSKMQISDEEKAQYLWSVQQGLITQAKEEIAKQEAKYLHQQEKVLEQEKNQLETKLQMAQKEYESCEKAEQQGLQNFAPKYVAS